MEGIHGHGLRPIFIDFLEIGAYKSEDYERSLKYDLSNYKDPTIVIKNYFDVFEVLKRNPKNGNLDHGTVISEEVFDRLKLFYEFLEKDQELFLCINYLLENNPTFPIV